MNAPKTKKSLAGQTCPYCDACGEIVHPGETTRFIESAGSEETEQLTPRELDCIREDLGVATQDARDVLLPRLISADMRKDKGFHAPPQNTSQKH